MAVNVPTLSLPADRESISTPALCMSLAVRRVDIGAENYATLDSGNLMSSKRRGGFFSLRGEKTGAVVLFMTLLFAGDNLFLSGEIEDCQ